MGINSYQSGQLGEDIAVKYLLQQNLKLVHKNFHSRFGEIDLIMRDGSTLVFIEVRKRYGGIDIAIESITPAKQKKLVKAAQYYLVKTGYDIACRFDALVMDGKQNIQWLKNIIF